MKLFGKEIDQQAVKEYFGDHNVALGHRQYMLEDGKEEHIHVCELNNGSGLRLEIVKSRGLDLGRCYYKDMPIAYRSYDGDCHPSYYEAWDDGWLRSFAGGLLVTGGLTSIGSPGVDHKETLPLHGRISNIPCSDFHVEQLWMEDELLLCAKGSVRESKALHYNLLLERTITMKSGDNSFHIHDEVHNEGFEDQEHMMLYHFNIGYPLLAQSTRFYSNSHEVMARDACSDQREEPYSTYLSPQDHYPDVVYYHDLVLDEDGNCHVALVNEEKKLGIALTFPKNVLDQFTQWKFCGKGNYVAGIEPCNARVNGREAERREGRLKILKAQECVTYDIDVRILDGEDEVLDFIKKRGLHT